MATFVRRRLRSHAACYSDVISIADMTTPFEMDPVDSMQDDLRFAREQGAEVMVVQCKCRAVLAAYRRPTDSELAHREGWLTFMWYNAAPRPFGPAYAERGGAFTALAKSDVGSVDGGLSTTFKCRRCELATSIRGRQLWKLLDGAAGSGEHHAFV